MTMPPELPTPDVAFVLNGVDDVIRMPAGARPFSPLASVRLRVLIPASELARRTNVVLVPLRHFIEGPSCAPWAGRDRSSSASSRLISVGGGEARWCC
jgi:hypothetical protein